MTSEIYQELADAVVSGTRENVIAAVEKARETVHPADIIEKGLIPGMTRVSLLFEKGRLFFPRVILSAEALSEGIGYLKADLPKTAGQRKPVIIVGTVEGDAHDIGKSIVSAMLQFSGYEVIDLGSDVPLENFIDKIKETNADMIGLSALMTTTLPEQKEIIKALTDYGLRRHVKVMVGGALATQAWADKIGADCYAENASEAIMKAKEMFGN
ncbi:Methionine synthase [Methanimicrococcus sp. At1]|uniref:Methionine synthase n=1 Tax=Methanimicrococcus hacksteinii TaxID=3028293 RepID=A0ABU3VQD0_9EURY|nr:corrinoid protein [Methanimicrococcus sp. At1]MDV0445607.1 Methionine synthase [Methanimicrococcus sp. At1]